MKKYNYDISYTQNRELSWLTFDERVLDEANDKDVPLYERLKFVSIFTSNLDEFYMIRVGSLGDIALLNEKYKDNKSGMTAKEQLKAIFKETSPLYEKRDKIYEDIKKELEDYDIVNCEISDLDKDDKDFLENYFKDYVLPVLSPQIVDNLHPFPHLQNLSLYIVALIKNGSNNFVGIVPIPSMLPRVIFLQGKGTKYVLIEKLILEYIDLIFQQDTITSKTAIRVTRNADISPDDESTDINDDYRIHMKKVLKKRGRLAPVRLEYLDKIKPGLKDYLIRRLKINKEQVFRSQAPLDLSYVFRIIDKVPSYTKRKITYSDFKPQIPLGINKNESIIDHALKKDIILFYPYEKMDPFLKLIKEAANDKDVVSIKITIYRLARKAKLIEYLTTAAENNKEVTVLMELKARFDEENNINWSETLQEAGCNVIFGFEDFKVHSKVCLITKRSNNEIKYITQIGTGNYNEKTAKQYTDLSLITSNENIGQDVVNFFNNISIAKLDGKYDYLLVAPYCMKVKIIELIDKEIEKAKNGQEALIRLKMNSLTDRVLIDKLQEASSAGVKIYMIIRGICCLIPGIKGKTDNIEVHSIVGRFLEHSRIYCFGNDEDMSMYISSADFMTRNMDKRVEVACPVYDNNIKKYLLKIMDVMLKDNVKGRLIDNSGKYIKLPKKEENEELNSQEYFIQEASKRAMAQKEIDKKNSELEQEKNSFVLQDSKDEIVNLRNEIKHANEILDEENERLKEIQNLINKFFNNSAIKERIAVTSLEEK